MCSDALRFFCGEKRYITAEVFPEESDETVVVTSAEFELIDKFKKEIIQKGTCERSGAVVKVFLDFTNVPAGNYELRVSIEAPPEKITSSTDIELAE